MGEAIKITPNESDKDMTRLRTNLKVWLVYSTDAFHLHMTQELKKCRNVLPDASFGACFVQGSKPEK